jgi:superfamily II DNA or RNA helicase
MIELNSYQIIPIKYIRNSFGLILFHSPGSGKTITSLSMAQQFPTHNIIVITTKSSIKNFYDDMKKLNFKSNIEFFTYKKFISEYESNINICTNKFVIIDEAHRLRNESRDMLLIISAISSAFRLVLLTATPIINFPSDISVLVNMVKKNEVLPSDKKLFEFYYVNEEEGELINKDMLVKKLSDTISYYENVLLDDFPKVSTQIMRVEMSPAQILEYKKYVGQIILEKKIVNVDTDVRLTDLAVNYRLLDKKKKNSFLSATRQLSNIIDKNSLTPKIRKIIDKIKLGPFPVLVYSNYLEFGVYPISKQLELDSITHKIISGSVTESKLDKIINDYNEGKIKVLLISSAGSESLDLKATRQVHIMEPHWNDAKIRQVIGRAIRYKSHEKLPIEERLVNVYRWISIFPPDINYQTADEYLEDLSIKKDNIFLEFKKLIIEACIENKKN